MTTFIRSASCVVALLLASCDGVALPDEALTTSESELGILFGGARSGTRLQAELLETPDGLRRFDQFHDTVLDSPCNFSPDENGEWRCIPEITAQLVFLDAACQEPAVVVDPTAALPPYFSTPLDSDACDERRDQRFSAWKRGEQVNATALYSKFGAGGACVPQPSSPDELVYRARPVDPSELVRGEFAWRFAGGWRLWEEVLVGEDGSRSHLNLATGTFLRSMYDAVLGTRVQPVIERAGGDSSAVMRWAGGTGAELPFFADATCTQRATAVTCGPQPHAVVRAPGATVTPACELGFSYLGVSSEPLTAVYAAGPPGPPGPPGPTCRALPPQVIDILGPLFAVEQPISLGAFLKGRLGRRAFGRLSLVQVENADGSRVPQGIFDEELGASCQFFQQGGEWRCFPTGTGSYSYADPQCTQPVIAIAKRFSDFDPIEVQTCFQGTRVAFTFDGAAPTQVTRHVGGAPISSAPVATYTRFGGPTDECVQTLDAWTFEVASSTTAELATAERVRYAR